MHNSLPPSRLQSARELKGRVEQFIWGQSADLKAFEKRYSIESFHDDIGPCIMLTDIVDSANVRMIERRSSACFALEPLERFRVPRQLLRQELEGNPPPQSDVLGLIDDTHPSAAQ